MRKIVVIGGTIFARNRGVAAITRGCIESLRKNIRDSEIVLIHTFVESCYPRKTTQPKNVKVIVDETDIRSFKGHVIKTLLRMPRAILWRMLSTLGINVKSLLNDMVLREIEKADAVINLSYGDMFSYTGGFYSQLVFFSLASQCTLAALLGKPLIFGPQSLGPFRSSFFKLWAKLILNRCTLIMVREESSREYLREMKIKAPILMVPDIAFTLKPAQDSIASEILSKENVEIKHPLIGISLRGGLGKSLEIIPKIIDYLILKINASFILIPHDSRVIATQDPRFLGNQILNKIEKKDQVYLIKGEYSVEELKAVIGKCDLFIGAFMHASISALSMCVPTVVMAYAPRRYSMWSGIMRFLGLEEFVVRVESMKPMQLAEKIEKAYYNREKIVGILKQRIPMLQETAEDVGKLVKNSVDN